MSADPFKTLRDRQLEYQASPVVLVDPATGEAGAIRLSGSSPAGPDQTGTGNDTVTFDEPTALVDVWNGGSAQLQITAGGVTRHVPPGGRVASFPEASDEFVIVADGPWVVTPMK